LTLCVVVTAIEIKDGAHKGDCEVNFEVEMTVSDPLIMATLDEVLKQVATDKLDALRNVVELPLLRRSTRFRFAENNK
jgi:hypothetical protein